MGFDKKFIFVPVFGLMVAGNDALAANGRFAKDTSSKMLDRLSFRGSIYAGYNYGRVLNNPFSGGFSERTTNGQHSPIVGMNFDMLFKLNNSVSLVGGIDIAGMWPITANKFIQETISVPNAENANINAKIIDGDEDKTIDGDKDKNPAGDGNNNPVNGNDTKVSSNYSIREFGKITARFGTSFKVTKIGKKDVIFEPYVLGGINVARMNFSYAISEGGQVTKSDSSSSWNIGQTAGIGFTTMYGNIGLTLEYRVAINSNSGLRHNGLLKNNTVVHNGSVTIRYMFW